jgi:hypothetical protein
MNPFILTLANPIQAGNALGSDSLASKGSSKRENAGNDDSYGSSGNSGSDNYGSSGNQGSDSYGSNDNSNSNY